LFFVVIAVMENLSVSLASSLQQEFFVPDITQAVSAVSLEKADGTTIVVFQISSDYRNVPYVTVRKPAGTGSSGTWSAPVPMMTATTTDMLAPGGGQCGHRLRRACVDLRYEIHIMGFSPCVVVFTGG
jgi:hypothetical protein